MSRRSDPTPTPGRHFGMVLLRLLGAALICTALVGCHEGDLEGREYQQANDADPDPRATTGPFEVHVDEAQPSDVPCAGCHTLHETPPYARTTADLTTFHQDVTVDHGDLECLSCHAREDRGELHLANGRRLELSEAMILCAQCHGPQYRDYLNGSHGGMTGYWDLQSGPRQRRNCIDCHRAHEPAYPRFDAVFPPGDRFLFDHDDHTSGADH